MSNATLSADFNVLIPKLISLKALDRDPVLVLQYLLELIWKLSIKFITFGKWRDSLLMGQTCRLQTQNLSVFCQVIVTLFGISLNRLIDRLRWFDLSDHFSCLMLRANFYKLLDNIPILTFANCFAIFLSNLWTDSQIMAESTNILWIL